MVIIQPVITGTLASRDVIYYRKQTRQTRVTSHGDETPVYTGQLFHFLFSCPTSYLTSTTSFLTHYFRTTLLFHNYLLNNSLLFSHCSYISSVSSVCVLLWGDPRLASSAPHCQDTCPPSVYHLPTLSFFSITLPSLSISRISSPSV